MTMQESKVRLENSRAEPMGWEFDARVVNKIKEIVAGGEDMLLRIDLGRSVDGYYDLYLTFRDAETGVECGEVDTSCPDPPFQC